MLTSSCDIETFDRAPWPSAERDDLSRDAGGRLSRRSVDLHLDLDDDDVEELERQEWVRDGDADDDGE